MWRLPALLRSGDKRLEWGTQYSLSSTSTSNPCFRPARALSLSLSKKQRCSPPFSSKIIGSIYPEDLSNTTLLTLSNPSDLSSNRLQFSHVFLFFFHVPAFWRACNNICSKKKKRERKWLRMQTELWLIGIRQRRLIIVGWGQTHPPAPTHRTPSNVWAGDWRCAHHTVCLGLNAVE